MGTYVMLTKISPESTNPPENMRKLEKAVKEKTAKHCPEVRWKASWAVLGPYDYVDVFEAPDEGTAAKVGTIVRSFGHATTETWGAIPWDQFKESLHGLSS